MNYPDSDDLYHGKFTDGDPLEGRPASRDNAAQMNAVYDEILATIQAGGLTPSTDNLTQLSASIRKQVQSKHNFNVAGDANAIVLTSVVGKPKITALDDFDELQFMVSATNTSASVTVTVDNLAPVPLANVVAANQLFVGSLVTLIYLQGSFQLKQAINPKTGSQVSDIGKLITDSLDIIEVGEVALNGAALSRAEHPILWAKVQATSNLIEQAKKDADQKTYAGYYGTGDGSTTFTLPIVGGEFIRMFDDGRGVDKGRGFGSRQKGSAVSANERFEGYVHGIEVNSSSGGSQDYRDKLGVDYGDPSDYEGTRAVAIESSQVTGGDWMNHYNWGGGESRPRNIAFYGKTRL